MGLSEEIPGIPGKFMELLGKLGSKCMQEERERERTKERARQKERGKRGAGPGRETEQEQREQDNRRSSGLSGPRGILADSAEEKEDKEPGPAPRKRRRDEKRKRGEEGEPPEPDGMHSYDSVQKTKPWYAKTSQKRHETTTATNESSRNKTFQEKSLSEREL